MNDSQNDDRAPQAGKIDRRAFFSSAVGGVVGATLASVGIAPAEGTAAPTQPTESPKLAPPSALQAAAEVPPPLNVTVETREPGQPGSDFMVDVIKSLGIEYVATMAASSLRGLHESIITYGGNTAPELITCLHEEASVAMAHGYSKVAGKPMAVMAHGTVGLQHALMAVYNAWCDRAPIVIISGNTLDAAFRREIEWKHGMQDPGAILRDCTKWDDQPWSLQHFSESMVRAYRIAATPPMGPVLISADSQLQELPRDDKVKLSIPRLNATTPPQGDSAALAQAAAWLVSAATPLVVADHAARTPRGLELMIELAEALGAPVVDRYGRLNMPTDHPLSLSDQSGSLVREADLILGLECVDFWGVVNQLRDIKDRDIRRMAKPTAKLVTIGNIDLPDKANYQNFERYAAVDLAITGDAEASLPVLIEAVRRAMSAARKAEVPARIERYRKLHVAMRAKAQEDAVVGWNVSPITLGRMHAELWNQIKHEDWAHVAESPLQSFWAQRLWSFEKHHQHIGGSTGFGIGYNAPAAVGAALAHRAHGRLVINVQTDGDLMCVPSALWTAAHHKIPMLTVMHNNRAYHSEKMHVQRMANWRDRGVDRAYIGTAIDNPAIDFAKLAQSMGVWASGPITNPADYAAALKRGIEVVKRGEPALIDLVTQGR